MSYSDVLQAQGRVREMNQMARQYVEHSNRHMQSNTRRNNTVINTEVKAESNPPPPALDSQRQGVSDMRRGAQGTRFVPLFNSPQRNFNRQRNMQGNIRPPEARPPNPILPPPPPPPLNPPPAAVHTPPPFKEQNKAFKAFKFPFDFKFGGLDEEKLIILALMALLYREKADIKLILALGYLIM
ncbi:MAG: hypothetical protein FWG90_09580 [Oscillospiraceae bacterium]|nr:hypothetical protein [Oscillospiraceae bacterium]